MRNIRITISYMGSAFHGWQRQKGHATVQGTIETALAKMTGEEIILVGSGRTDAGVHALAQVANFKTASTIPLHGFLKGLNSLLPKEISILNIEEVEEDFHARKSARKKRYMYRIVESPVRLPLIVDRAWIIGKELNLSSMKEAASCLVGTHDFSSFAASGTSVKTMIRSLFEIDFHSCTCPEYLDMENREIRLFFEADGFLRYMVRNMVGLLVDIGLGRREWKEAEVVLRKKDRSFCSPTAPAQGLYLMKVFY